jgi:protein NrfD
MPDTFFTTSPQWTWWIVPYFFIGGIAGGAMFLAALLHLFGRPQDRPVVRSGYYVAFAGAIVSGLLLVLDLQQSGRFWHMLIQSNTGRLMFKPWSPMSVGSWVVLLFGLLSFLLALGAAHEEGRIRWRPLRLLSAGALAGILAFAGSLAGLFLAGYTGVLLSVSNRPIWADSTWLGMLFLFSGGSTAAATLTLVGAWRRTGRPTIPYLRRFDGAMLVLELLALVIFVISLGAVARVLLSWWGVLLVLGVVVAGILIPLRMSFGKGAHGERAVAAASLVLLGGLLLRVVILLASNGIHQSAVAGRVGP